MCTVTLSKQVKNVFENVRVHDLPKTKEYRILKVSGKVWKTQARPPLKDVQKEKSMAKVWAKENMETSYLSIISAYRTLDDPDGWKRGLYCHKGPRPQRIRRQQGGLGAIFLSCHCL